MIAIEPRPLGDGERDTIRAIYSRLGGTCRHGLEEQLNNLVVVATWAPHSASVEIRPSPGARVVPVDVQDGPLPVRSLVYQGEDAVGEVILWVSHGILSAIEYAYYLGDTPSELPAAASLGFS